METGPENTYDDVHKIIFNYLKYLGFQKRVLHLLTEIRNAVQQVGQRCEPLESEFHLSQATEFDQFQALENSIADMETKKLLVSISRSIILLFIVLSPRASSTVREGRHPQFKFAYQPSAEHPIFRISCSHLWHSDMFLLYIVVQSWEDWWCKSKR